MNMALLLPLSMLVALLVDRLFGEPPAWMHPVVAMGRALGVFSQRLLKLPPATAFVAGALLWGVIALPFVVLATVLEFALIKGTQPASASASLLSCSVALGLMLKPLMAWRMLSDEVAAVEAALRESLEAGRLRLSRLVSRDTSALSAAEVREAAIETLAENLNDSVVAPLFWFAVAGLPGAALYRFANTADAMWGYRGRWEWAGKWAAWADDVLSWIPARITALALMGSHLGLLGQVRREALRTPSPNGGWPMAAVALRLQLRLSKPGVYVLNAKGEAPGHNDIERAYALAFQALLVAASLLALLAFAMRWP
ncbi:adenosylcobinamide-phosphate synthase CbiB [Roseateles koreensis]|uniref:Cobalamin biosynthesis protein CobD n=1 Tax=Roseateles koreensis TaxID=2987526 RepID=A0ABT5KS77_9BURK|nr:adenosylcobinamide-phosphate synthase CbiB [Roseateles koreensis]MDC8785792.1 adenosylcobinamide-phosphate synthase CbiB [Roseateles koreensis]